MICGGQRALIKNIPFYHVVPFILEKYDTTANEDNSNSAVFSHFSFSSVLYEGLFGTYLFV